MQLAIFDLDNTLIAGDSDYLWGEFLCEKELIDPVHHRQMNDQYYDDYRKGELNIDEFLIFQLRFIAGKSASELEHLRQEFIDNKIRPICLSRAFDLVNQHRKKQHQLLIITATNRFITEPIARLFDVDTLIATEVETDNGKFTGSYTGIPSFAEGKVKRLRNWLENHPEKTEKTWFYSDSHNDIPLLEYVDYPVAVDPDKVLFKYAHTQQWEIISLRNG